MKRPALSVLTALLPAAVLFGGMAYADVVTITPMPYIPDTATAVGLAEGVLAEAGVPADLGALPVAELEAAIATVETALRGLGIPAVPLDAQSVLHTVEAAVAGAGLPLDVPALPALPDAPALPDVPALPAVPDVLLDTVTEAVAGLGLPLETPALPAAPDLAGVLTLVEDSIAGLGISLPGS
jgi:hypothetical protein